MGKLEQGGYVKVTKAFQGKLPHTDYALTEEGRKALGGSWEALDAIRGIGSQGH